MNNVKGNQPTKEVHAGIGQTVRALRTQQGLTLQVAATRGGTTPATWIQLEKHNLATTRTLNNVAKALGVTVDELTGRRT